MSNPISPLSSDLLRKPRLTGAAEDEAVEEPFRAVADKLAAEPDTGNPLPPEVTVEEVFSADLEITVAMGDADAESPPEPGELLLVAAGFVVESVAASAGDDASAATATLSAKTAPGLMTTTELNSPKGPAVSAEAEMAGEGSTKEFRALLQTMATDSPTPASNAQAQLQSVPKPAAPPAAELAVPVKVAEPGWQDSMAGRITFMVNQKISVARIHVTPPEMGPVEVKVNLNHDQASVHFVSHSAQVRDALEQSVPRLREMLEAGGFALVDSQVSDQSDRSGSDGQRQGSGNEPLVDAAQEEVKATAVPEGAIDFYA
ncbi:MAG: flagellar hook-length control protein FliK [Pseudomonadales bacterium]|nr:flagellar hook-length control protein FliK [Pseudomonadales bacterium]